MSTEFIPHSADWITRGHVHARGRAFDSDKSGSVGAFLQGTAIAEHFLRALTADSKEISAEIVATAKRLEGCYAVVITGKESSYLVVDGIRSIPLFYDRNGQVASDHGKIVARELNAQKNPITMSELILTRYVLGNETIWDGILAVNPGEVVKLSPAAGKSENRSQRTTYREYWPDGIQRIADTVEGKPRARLEAGLQIALDRLEVVADQRPILIPLSGGYDSRLLASALVERDHEVIAFTFGRSGHPDVEVSRAVASRLGIQWEWCEYSDETWRQWYHENPGLDCRKQAFLGNAIPLIAAGPALTELTETGRIPKQALYCPGHTVATPSSRLPRFVGEVPPTSGVDSRDVVTPDIAGLTEYILGRHYTLWNWDDERFSKVCRDRIARVLLGGRAVQSIDSATTAAAAYERFEWSGRMSTFTISDLRIAETCGLDWWLPLWDPAYVAAWSTVPLPMRRDKSLQTDLVVECFSRVTGISREEAAITDRTLSPIDRYLSLIRYTPEYQWTEQHGLWEPSFLAPRSQWHNPDDHPLAWYGAVNDSIVSKLPGGIDFYSLRTLSEMGLLDLTDPTTSIPESGKIEVPIER